MKKIWKYVKKKRLIIIFSGCLILCNKGEAQITLDTTITLQALGYNFYTVQISKSETKYLFEDTVTNTFSLYNMDFTPFLLNIAVPEPFGVSTFQVIYVTRTLFDCDSTNIEYAYESSLGDNNHPFYIMRTDGTQLFKLDSAVGPYCIGGCLGLSDVIVPIRNTSAGTKLFLQHGQEQAFNIYSLCGALGEDVLDFTNANKSFVKLFPNPTSGSITFQINLPDNMNEYELVILDNNARVIRKEKINFKNTNYSIDVANLSSGTYFFSLSTKNKAYQSGKFILTK